MKMSTSSASRIILVLLLVAVTGCERDPGNPDKPVTASAPSPPPDHSPSVKTYTDAGVPDISNAWSGEEMIRAAESLEKLTRSGKNSLPRVQSPNSGELFARLVADDNLNFARDPDQPLKTRVRTFSTRYRAAIASTSCTMSPSSNRKVSAAAKWWSSHCRCYELWKSRCH